MAMLGIIWHLLVWKPQLKIMKKIPVLIVITLGSICQFSCSKAKDASQTSITEAVLDPTVQHKVKEFDACEVQQIVYGPCCNETDTLVFTYNSWGDPALVQRLPRPTTGAPNYIFRYDSKRRLTDVIGMYDSPTMAEFWNKYYYDKPGNSNIVKDSSFLFVEVKDNEMVSYRYSAVTYFTYDKWDRIIKDSTFSEGHTYVNNYVYDMNGNLAGRTYDNQVNIHRTNKIWMFFDRDYSLNNPFPAASYNGWGLPTRLSFTFQEPYHMQFLTYFKNATITYTCGKELHFH